MQKVDIIAAVRGGRTEKVVVAGGGSVSDFTRDLGSFEKKWTRLRTNTKTLEDLCSQSLKTASQAIHDVVTTHKVTASQHFETASARTDSYADLEDSTYDGIRKDWSYKLDNASWAFRTTFKTPLGTTLFRIIYGKACHLPVELEHKAY
ncbi:KRAB-A domain-containing protein 2-like protein [Tanacetum coccineum]